MNRIAAATVIRGNGACMAYVNGVAQAEIIRQREADKRAMAAYMEHARTVENSRNRLLAERLEARCQPAGCLERMFDRLIDRYALIVGSVLEWLKMAGRAVLEFGERVGFWERVDDNAEY